jgi:flagellar basal-body rod modification protein FlgD
MAVGSATSANPVSSVSSTASLSSATAAEQQDRFMKLLVAQMKNQDPLNPMDNAQMTSQIAQINTVSGIEKLNRTVEGLLSAFSGLQAQNATQMAGRAVLIEGSTLSVGEYGAVGGVELEAAADAVAVEIRDASGAVVQTLDLGKNDAGVRSFQWDGKNAAGEAVPQGDYRISVKAASGEKAVKATTLMAAQVQSVYKGTAGVQLDLGAAGSRSLDDVKSYF